MKLVINTKMLNLYDKNLPSRLIELRDSQIPGNKEAIEHVYEYIRGQCSHITPSLDNVLRCIELPPKQVKVMIIGQDPYPEYGAATGLAFSINRMVSARGSGKSVYKIAKEVYRCINYPMPDNISGNLDHWQEQGVMLLNSALTTRVKSVDAHGPYWRNCVMGIVIDYMKSNPNIIVLCLGAKARELVKDIKIKHVFYQQHPNAPRTNLIGSDVFLKINELIDGDVIDWRFMEELNIDLINHN